jgi:NADPH:quinone reductase-like Zn-dependent oxidoreductase
MRAIGIEEYGQAPAMLELPEPIPGPGEIVVTLRAASLNPLDRAVAAGHLAAQFPAAFPLVLGFDGAGEVAALGEGAGRFAVGDPVFGQFWSAPIGRGTFADRVAIAERGDSGSLMALPDGISPEVAAAIPTAGQTAYGVIEELAPAAGESLLVVGATGGVGSLAVQLAALRGAHVIATARADAAAWIEDLGAAETIDHGAGPLADLLAAVHPAGVGALLDLTGDQAGVAALVPHVKDGGRIRSIGFGVGEELRADTRVAADNYMNVDKPSLLAGIAEEIRVGNVRVAIQREIGLAEVPAALAARGGARGKTLVQIEASR